MAAEQVSWQDKVSKKKATQSECIPEAWRLSESDIKTLSPDANVLALPEKCGLLLPQELEITSKYDVVALSEKLREGSLTATAVVTAFCKRAAIAHQAV
jgi:amidase